MTSLYDFWIDLPFLNFESFKSQILTEYATAYSSFFFNSLLYY